jgi:hypothetical protein
MANRPSGHAPLHPDGVVAVLHLFAEWCLVRPSSSFAATIGAGRSPPHQASLKASRLGPTVEAGPAKIIEKEVDVDSL